jgi:hypothetical protein
MKIINDKRMTKNMIRANNYNLATLVLIGILILLYFIKLAEIGELTNRIVTLEETLYNYQIYVEEDPSSHTETIRPE